MIGKIGSRTIMMVNSKELQQYFGDAFKLIDEEIMKAARHGVSEAINTIRDATRSNISSSPFNSKTSKKYGVGLIEGLNAYMWQNAATGFVDILGNRKSNDGTWMLRFFEGGTKERIQRSTHRKTGKITGYRFLENAFSSTANSAYESIRSSIQKRIEELNQ